MPFSSLTDPADLARAYAALEAVRNEVKLTIPEQEHDEQRRKIAYLVAGFAPMALDEDDLKQNILLHIRQDALA
ncbi:hypothetical protein [Bosea sp. UNC402CLCol]|uniref:hypothetical protein n=1 Tax=Bosea sp. UNC402CLCol TaxID=1510531 RepID=UPI0005713405|nr:hypothetical protein [Bosea sp. UNC402CLCol]